MSAPAQVTEAHRKLACEILFECSPSGQATPAGVKAAGQLIADSEALAIVEIAMVAAASADRNVSLRLERDQLTDALDMMRDEFQRIIACPGCNAEIEDLANRAQLKLIQHVPVIVQRDRAEAEAMKLRVKNRELRAALTACHSAMLGKVNPKHPAWAVLFAVTEGDK